MIEVELRVLYVGDWGFADLTRRLTMPFPPCIGLVIHQGGEDDLRLSRSWQVVQQGRLATPRWRWQ
jgi:hypothetical protein